jgi:uncharacterized protein YecE (DUF72 family)
MTSSSRTNPWSKTRIASSAITLSVAATSAASLVRAHVGASGWSYPSWRPGFYPAGADPKTFLAHYAARFDTVELNTTGYRLPAEEQFRRWAEQVPDGFQFSVKLPGNRPQIVAAFDERVRHLGDRLGPVRVVLTSARDDGMIELLLGSLDPEHRLAFDLQHPSWDGVEERLAAAGAVRVDDLERPAPFRYLRLREPPYSDDDLRSLAEKVAAIDEPAYVYFRHEDEPTAPRYAERLLALLSGA